MAIYGYTKNYKLIKPQYDTDTWHDYEYDNLDTIDAVLSAIYSSGDWQGFWKSNTHYNVKDIVIDRDTDTMYKVMVEHTTSEATFAAEQTAHPDYYELWSPNNLAESWATKTDDKVSNTDYSAKAYAISSGLTEEGSAKEWAIGSGAVGNTNEYSAKKYATDAHNDYVSMTTNPNVVAVGSNINNVNVVGSSISNVNTVASNVSSVNTVAGVSTDVTTVASVASSVPTVANNDANITTVATNISDVNTAATNIEAIKDAPNQASSAQNSAAQASQSATSANASASYAAGVEANIHSIVDDAVQTLSERLNTPFFFGQSMYSDVAPDNASWLASNGQYNARSVYPDYYDWLLEQMNAGVSGFVASTAAYTDYDFVINTADQTFRLPLLNGEEDLPSDRYDNLTISATTQTFTAPANGIYTVSGVGFGWVDIANETSGGFGSCSQPRTADGYGKYTLNVKQGDQIAVFCAAIPSSYICRFIYAKGNGSLYYYVGDTVQDASLINAGAVLGQLSDKISRTATSDRETVVGWGMPDYTAGVSMNTPYTAPKSGVIIGVHNLSDSGYRSLTINSVSMYNTKTGASYLNGQSAGFCYPVAKGAVISWTNFNKMTFYPCIGVK